MIKALVSDFSRTILFPKDELYEGGLNSLYKKLQEEGSYNFYDHYGLNESLLKIYERVKPEVKKYIFTTGYVQSDDAIAGRLDEIFDAIYNLDSIGANSKENSQSYKMLAEKLGINPEEIVFVDDIEVNIRAANDAGFETIHYLKDNKKVSDRIVELGLI